MKIDGTKIAQELYLNLLPRVKKLKEQGIVPQIAVILIGDDPASISYITQKRKWSKSLGLKFSLFRYPADISNDKLLKVINNLNKESKIHGIIIQRPVPIQINKKQITETIVPQKDIDGFAINSPFDPPVARAVMHVLEKIYNLRQNISNDAKENFINWLKSKSITILGKGETAGGPIINHLQRLGLKPRIITSQTEYPEKIIKKSDIVITAVGKSGVLKPDYLKKNVILLGVGMYKGLDGKLHGDYLIKQIKSKASFYTPVTGGIGPVNVAFLLKNLVLSAEKHLQQK